LQRTAGFSGLDVAAAPGSGQSDGGVYDFSGGGAFTLACWVNATSTQSAGAGIIAKGYGNGGEQYALEIFGGDYRFYLRDQNGLAWGEFTTNTPNGLWQHLAVAYSGANELLSFYINGQVVMSYPNVINSLTISPSLPPTSLLSSTHELSVGNRQSSSTSAYNLPFTGLVDDVHIYNRALNSGDIQALIAAGSSRLVAGTITFSSSGSTLLTNGNIKFSGSASGGSLVANDSYRVWATTNVALPFSQWSPVQTNTFGANGQFSFTIPNPGTNNQYFELSVP
jgi:Concanavalin A-like lectin/glucanases superfamily